jgi:hypothetical protein
MQDHTHEELLRRHQSEAAPSRQPSRAGGHRLREWRFRLAVPRHGRSRRGDRRSGSPTVILSCAQSASAVEAPLFSGRFGGD